MNKETLQLVIVGHVDHGKSTFIGRLLADTQSLPKGKLDQVKTHCERHSRPFEYAFLLDALKDEQAQGITIDTARSFFKTDQRHYIILDAPGHIEFLKNMVTGAARADAAVVMIDAKEGIQENSRRHGYLLAMLGIQTLIVVVNKMDLVGYSQSRFDDLVSEYQSFLASVHTQASMYIPISAFDGENMTTVTKKMDWYEGLHALDAIESIPKPAALTDAALRFPIQDIYKFTDQHDDRRILAGTVATGCLRVGDLIRLSPSDKTARVKSIERFNAKTATMASAGEAIGITLDTQLYVKPGELLSHAEANQQPSVSAEFKAHIFWLNRRPLKLNQRIKIKCNTSRVTAVVSQIHTVLDASDRQLTLSKEKGEINRHDIATCTFTTLFPLAADTVDSQSETSRFVIVTDTEIAGGGILLSHKNNDRNYVSAHRQQRDIHFERGHLAITKGRLIIITGPVGIKKAALAKDIEQSSGHPLYCLIHTPLLSLNQTDDHRLEHLIQAADVFKHLLDSGQSVITAVSELTDADYALINALISPHSLHVYYKNRSIQSEIDTLFTAT